jgi:Leucine-rich repeat (LRR) protein
MILNRKLLEKLHNDLYTTNYLNLTNYDICKIDKNTFKDLDNIQLVYMNNNILTKIKKHMFVGLKNLHVLYLNGNQTQLINKNAFDCLPKLNLLALKENNINRINEKTFKSFLTSYFDPTIKNIKSYKNMTIFYSAVPSQREKIKKNVSYFIF